MATLLEQQTALTSLFGGDASLERLLLRLIGLAAISAAETSGLDHSPKPGSEDLFCFLPKLRKVQAMRGGSETPLAFLESLLDAYIKNHGEAKHNKVHSKCPSRGSSNVFGPSPIRSMQAQARKKHLWLEETSSHTPIINRQYAASMTHAMPQRIAAAG